MLSERMALDLQWVSKTAQDIRRKTWGPYRSRRFSKRAILKGGDTNVFRTKLTKIGRWRFLQDISTTLLDAQWRWTLQFLAVEFFGSWLFFALIWWLIAFVHGDLHQDHLPIRQAETGWTPCILNIHGFHSCFLYSLETQHTTGYGLRVITEECPEAIFILCFQCIIGMIIDSFTVGIVFAKMVRSKLATHTIQFSKNAVLCHRDNKLCFMFRVGDIRRSRIIGVGVRAVLVRNERTKEGEILKHYQTELPLRADGSSSSLFLLWPITVFHEINEGSPLYDLSTPELLRNQNFEIIVILNATVESTGVSTEAKSSYLVNEILWGRRFESVVSFNKNVYGFEVDWKKFDNTVPVNTCLNYVDSCGNISDTQETTPLEDQDQSTTSKQKIRKNTSQCSLEDEMIKFEYNASYFPRHINSPVPQEIKSRKSLFIQPNQIDKFDYPATIQEDEEHQHYEVSYV